MGIFNGIGVDGVGVNFLFVCVSLSYLHFVCAFALFSFVLFLGFFLICLLLFGFFVFFLRFSLFFVFFFVSFQEI